jgi:hypothetical protein
LQYGTPWKITFNSVTHSSTTTTISFTKLATGNYSWSTSTQISGGTGIQYVASLSSATICVSTETSQKITYTTQYYLTVSSASGITGGRGWYDSGATAYAALSAGRVTVYTSLTGTVSGDTAVQYVFTGWAGEASGTDLTSNCIIMDSAKTATAIWAHLNLLNVTQLNTLPTQNQTQSQNQSLFYAESNSIIANAAFNSARMELIFTVSEPPSATGYLNVIIAKSLAPDSVYIKVFVDRVQVRYSLTSNETSWLLFFTYLHSTHQVIVQIEQPATTTPQPTSLYQVLPATVILLVVAASLIILWRRRRKKSEEENTSSE